MKQESVQAERRPMNNNGSGASNKGDVKPNLNAFSNSLPPITSSTAVTPLTSIQNSFGGGFLDKTHVSINNVYRRNA
jgi:hypothetical protein